MLAGIQYGQHEIAGQQRLVQNVVLVLTDGITLTDTLSRKKNGVNIAYDRKYTPQPGDYLPKYDPTPDTP